MTLLPQVRSQLDAAARAQIAVTQADHRSRRSRIRSTARGIPILLAVGTSIAIAVLALTALRHHPSAGHPATPVGTARVVAVAPDPHGGLLWGLREVHTARGQVCLQVGRLKDGTIGVLGRDGAWANDHLFHPISLTGSPSGGLNCGGPDRNGNAWVNVVAYDQVASAYGSFLSRPRNHCLGSSATGRSLQLHFGLAPCPRADHRALFYGLLGPDATSVTYQGIDGRLHTEPTSRTDGAYLIVEPQTKPLCVFNQRRGRCSASFESIGPLLQSGGAITAVSYRDGRACQLPIPASGEVRFASCPPVGYQPPPSPLVTKTQIAARVTARVLPAERYCTSTGPNTADCSQIVLSIAFTARVAATSPNSYYEGVVDMPPRDYTPGGRRGCPGASQSVGPTQRTIHPGQQLRWRVDFGSFTRDCVGNTVNITIGYVRNSYLGLNGIGSLPAPSLGRGATVVGKTNLVLP